MKRLTLRGCFVVAGLSASALEINRDLWREHVEQQSPEICAARYFDECFEEHQAQCRIVARRLVRQCFVGLKDEIPAKFSVTDSIKWGAQVGQCLGERLETSLKKKAELSDYCLEPLDEEGHPK